MFHRTSGKSRVSTLGTTKSTTTVTTSKGLLKPRVKGTLSSGVKKVTTGKIQTKKSAAKGSSQGLTTTSKLLASKAKIVSAKQIAKTVKAGKVPPKGTLKVKQKVTLGFKSTAPKNLPDAEQDPSNKEHVVVPKATDSDTSTNNTVEGGEEIVTGGKVSAPEIERDSTAQVKLGGAGAEAAEPMEVGSCAEAGAENPADRPSESRPSTSSVGTAPTETSREALPLDRQHTLSEPPESTAAAPESGTDAPQVEQQAAVGEVGTNASQKGELKSRWMC